MADSFQGGVGHGSAGSPDLRARVAIQGASIHALTGDEIFRIPLSRCSLSRAGPKILVRDHQSSLEIWSEDEGFLDALERAQHGTLREQVRGLRRAAHRKRLFKWGAFVLIATAALRIASVPLARWAVGGGVPSIANRVGESSLERLAFPTGVAPMVERELLVVAERLRLAASPSTRLFQVRLADYDQVHSFSLPPSTVVVTAGLVCNADGPNTVIAAAARELAHLENNDVRERLAEAVDWDLTLALLLGDTSGLNSRMLDFASVKHSPGFTVDQERAAEQRASVMLGLIGVSPVAAQASSGEEKSRIPEIREAVDWLQVRTEACDLIGR